MGYASRMEKTNIPWPVIEQKLAGLNKNPAWLAHQLRTGTNTVSNWKKRGGAPLDRARDMAAVLQCSADELLNPQSLQEHLSVPAEKSKKIQKSGMIVGMPSSPGRNIRTLIESNVGERLKLKDGRAVAVVGEVQGGPDGYISIDDYPPGHGNAVIPCAWSQDPGAYGLRVRGDSMRPRIKSGEYIVVEPNSEAQPGDDVVVKFLDGSAVVKELLWIRDGDLRLGSINNEVQPITRSLTDIAYIHRVAAIMPRGAAIEFEE